MSRLLLMFLLPLHVCAADLTPSGKPVPAMALMEQGGIWQLQTTQLQAYLDEFGALAEIRGTQTDARLNLVDARLHSGVVPNVITLSEQTSCYNDAHEPKVFVQPLLKSDDYQLECRGDANGHYSLQWHVGERSQMLPGSDSASGSWQLLWAGDLNRDGQPDLVSEYSYEGGYCQQVLLSANAEANQLLVPGVPYCLAD